ncbi:RNA polymerase sigma factor [Bacillus pacificus]
MNKCNDIVRKNNVLYVDDYGKVQGDQIVKDNIEQKLEFDNLLSYLSVEYRLVIVLYYVNKFKTKEIAEILNEKEGTIKSRLHRARQQLKEYYLKEDWENVNNGGNLK